jgi:hypothetical protein
VTVSSGTTNDIASVPLELVEQIRRGNGLVFVGESIASSGGQGSELGEWTAELGHRCGLAEPAGTTATAFHTVSQLYEDTHGRQALVQFVRDEVDQAGSTPREVHRLLASLRECRVFVTTCLDRRLEQALADAGRPPVILVRNLDVAFADEQRTQVYRIRGTPEQADSLVLTEDDCDQFFDDENSISVVLQGYLARCTILFLGYDLADPSFKRLYRRVTANLDGLARRAYLFGNAGAPAVNGWCKRHGIDVIETECEPALRELVAQVAARRTRPRPEPPDGAAEQRSAPQIVVRPYKLLDYFGPDDTSIYFARERESLLLASLIHGHRLTVLYGGSGTGKTSLLLAGVMPRLEATEPGYLVIYVRLLESPGEAIRRQVRRKLGDHDLHDQASLVEFLDRAVALLSHPLVLLLDQFEEFFMRLSDAERMQFIRELGQLNDARDLAVKTVICLREDWLAYMNEVRERIPEVFNVDLRLLPLTPEQARRAIVEPVTRVGMEYSPEVVDRLLLDLCQAHSGAAEGGESSLMPPHLQLVCDALYEHARTQDRVRIEMSDYVAVGEVNGVLANYVEDALRKHPAAQRALARELLVAMVSSQSTRSLADVPTAAAEIGADTATVTEILERLVDQRLVRELDDRQFELAHDSLAVTIAAWIDDARRQRKQVQEMVRRQEREWRQNPAYILGRGRFDRVNLLRDDLNLAQGETVFVLRAALLYDIDVAAWLARLGDPSLQTAALLEALQDPVALIRRGAATHLGAHKHDEQAAQALAQTALSDADPDVRQAAAFAAGRVGLSRGIDIFVAAAADGAHRTAAFEALARAVDAAPEMLAFVPVNLRRHLITRLGRIRMHRHRREITGLAAAGAIGGAIGIGAGMAVLMVVGSLPTYRADGIDPSIVVIGALVFAVFGAVIGAALGYCAAVGSTVAFRLPRLGTALGAVLGAALSFVVLISPFGPTDLGFAGAPLVLLAGTAFFGAAVGVGAVLPALLRWPWWSGVGSGAICGSLGIAVCGLAGYPLFGLGAQDNVPAPLVLGAGAWMGLWIAFFVQRREHHVPYLARILPADPEAAPPGLP